MQSQKASLAFLFLLLSHMGVAATPTAPVGPAAVPPTDYFWAVSVALRDFDLASKDDDHDVSGIAGQVGFGLSWFAADRILISGMGEVVAGPWRTIRNGTFNGDFAGAGFTADSVFCLFADSCRSGSSTWALGVAASYLDLSGRSIGRNRKDTGDPKDSSNAFLERDYKINVASAWLTPSIVWMRFEKPRPSGNTPELLLTRVEGTSFRIGVALPVFAKFRASILRRNPDQGADQQPWDNIEKGHMTGYSVLATLHMWLGS